MLVPDSKLRLNLFSHRIKPRVNHHHTSSGLWSGSIQMKAIEQNSTWCGLLYYAKF